MKSICKLLFIFCLPALIFPLQLRSYEIPPQRIAHEFSTQIPTFPCTLEEMFIFIEQFDHDEFWEILTVEEAYDILNFIKLLVHWGTNLGDEEAHLQIESDFEELFQMLEAESYEIHPAILQGDAKIVLCGGIGYSIKKLGKKIKKHKKGAIIVGGAIIIGFAIGWYALAAAGAASAATSSANKKDAAPKEPQASNEPPPLPEPIKATIIAYQEEISHEVNQTPNTPSLCSKTLDNTKELSCLVPRCDGSGQF